MPTYYESTRNNERKISSKQAILEGISKGGGLYVRPDLDQIQLDLNTICRQSYKENALYILSRLLPDYTEAELKECIDAAYTDNFDTPEITPLRKVGDIYVCELFHGPTSAFKDVALTLLPQLMRVALRSAGQKALILTATSGDTGKAALEGFRDVDDIGIVVYYPHQKVSQIQYRQMATQRGSNVKVYAVKGNFDDAQSQVKRLFLDPELNQKAQAEKIMLTSANSINIGRLVPQIVYYFESYKQLVKQNVITVGDPISFSVPTGNFGDVLAGYYGYLMGLPVKKFYVASNANHVLTDFLTTGTYDRNRPFIQTISPSMDILISSNLERLLYYMSGKDNAFVASCMEQLKTEGKYTIPQAMLERIRERFDCGYVDDEGTKAVIREVYEKDGVVLDPHTAIGYRVAEKADRPVVSLATASPYKFSVDVLDAIGKKADDQLQAMNELHKVWSDPVPKGLAELPTLPILHKDVIEVNEMKQSVENAMETLFHD
ncbi:threonine synthase [Catenisphaera adipataccumulans]|uniref:Threonine synthase n=1 Tax=Catenisphaera adipataccumulans TaxID=700500 RepID=A0A7W8FXH9_9FIRM|nr:threonine synthase [Catenisphaera adipataccumulans]MBB5182947.1 threonine synthase [Catenisphaera adipataccumulans]